MAGGVPAGTLSIEIVAELAKLQEDMRKVEQVVGGMANGVGKSTRAVNDNFASMGKSAGAQRAGMQQLGAQFSDLGVQMTSAAGSANVVKGVLSALAMQGPQIVAAVDMMRKSTGGFIGFLAGPWGAAIMAATSVLGILGAEFLGSGDKAERGAKSVDAYTNALNRMVLAAGKATAADIGLNKVRLAQLEGQRRGLDQQIAGAQGTRAAVQRRGQLAEQRGALDTQIFNLRATIDGTEKAVAAQRKLNALTAADAANTRTASAARREHNKELRAAESAANKAAKAFEELQKWLASTRMEAQGGVFKLAEEMDKRNQEWGKDQATVGDQLIQQAKDLEALTDAQLEGQRQLLDIYLQQVDALGRMGGVFRPLAGILTGLKTGNFSGVGGKVGGLLGLPTGGTTKDIDGRVIAETLGDKLKEVFGKNGEFFQNFSSILANAAIGSTTAGLAGGNKLGGAIGGAIGGKLGKDLLTKPLTDAFGKTLGGLAGPLGSIAGGLLGGVVGGLFKPAPKYGTSRLYMDEYGQLTGTKAKGNDAAAQRAATSLAGGVGKGLMSIAETLGAKITNVPTNIVLGTFDGKYRVNTEGRGGKMDFKGNSAKGLHNFGDDQQAAIEFAIQKSIEGAVLSGISQASINILKSGQDLQKAIEKATMIEDIPKELQRRFDPVGYAIDELNRKWEKTVSALREGGATAQQMADAQKLYNLELIDAKENASSASQTLKEFLKSMNMGANSPLSLRDQAMSAKAALDPFLAQINAGQAINQDKYLEAAQTYLDIERQMYGSTAKYFEAFDAIQAATNKAIATVDNAAPIRTTADPFIEQAASATKATAAAAENTAANTANANILLGKLEGKLDQVIAALKENGGTWTGSLRNYG